MVRDTGRRCRLTILTVKTVAPPYGEPGEPLEYLAGDLDWAATSPPGNPQASREEKWSYRPRRGYATVGTDLYASALSELRSLRAGAKGAAPRQHFYDPARWAHQSFYCLGTIPGNPDSHDPNNTSVQPWWHRRTRSSPSATA